MCFRALPLGARLSLRVVVALHFHRAFAVSKADSKVKWTAADDRIPRTNVILRFAIYKQEGMGAFFRGFTPCVLRAFPANAAAFVGFEMALRYLPDRLGTVEERVE